MGSVKDKVFSFFKTKLPKDYDKQTMYGRGKKPSKTKTQKQFEETMKSLINIFKL